MMKNLLSFAVMMIALLLTGCGQSVHEEQAAEETAVNEVAMKSETMDQAVEGEEAGRCVFFFSYKDGEKQLHRLHAIRSGFS